MAPDRVGARLLDVRSEEAGVVLKSEFRACVSNAENAGDRDERDDHERDHHLRDGEPTLLRRCSAVWFHLRDYLREGPSWSIIGNRCSGQDYVEIDELS